MNGSRFNRLLQFTIESPPPGCLHSVRLYQFILKENSGSELYSFCFRYTTLKEIQDKAQDHELFPRGNENFPQKIRCPCKRSIERKSDFCRYFNPFFNDNSLSNMSQFLELMGLPSTNKDFLNFDLITIKTFKRVISDPFKDEDDPSASLKQSEYPFFTPNENFPLEEEHKQGITPSEPPSLGISQRVLNDITLAFKREENKIIFLGFLDEKLAIFAQKYQGNKAFSLRNIKCFQLMVMKVKLKLVHKIIYDIDMKPNEGAFWSVPDEFTKFLKSEQGRNLKEKITIINKETIPIFRALQCEILNEIKKGSFLEKKDVNEILKFVNPKIKDWTEFIKVFQSLGKLMFEKFSTYIERIVNLDLERLEEINQDVVMLYKNLQVLLNLKKIFDEMEGRYARQLNLKKFEENDTGSCRRALQNLSII